MRAFCVGVLAVGGLALAACSTPSPPSESYIDGITMTTIDITTSDGATVIVRMSAAEDVRIFCFQENSPEPDTYAIALPSGTEGGLWTNKRDEPLAIVMAYAAKANDPAAKIPDCAGLTHDQAAHETKAHPTTTS